MHVVLKLNYHRLDHLAPLFQALYNRFPDADMQFEQEPRQHYPDEMEPRLVLNAQPHSITDEDRVFFNGLVKQHLISVWFHRPEDYEEEPLPMKPGEINQLAFSMVKPHLEIAGPAVEKRTPPFTAALQAYLADPTDPTGMRLYNLREMAKSLQMDLTIIVGLLTQIETRPKTS